MTAPRFPGAVWLGNGRRYGTLTTSHPTCLILHSTETRTVPGYDNGNAAPHLTGDIRARRWYQHQEFDAWVGTMKGGQSPISVNAKARQIEYVAYSDRTIADRVGGLWVGDLTDADYEWMAEPVAWLHTTTYQGRLLLPTLTVYQPAVSWTWGPNSPYRMTMPQYLLFNGITAHGAAPAPNAHWNTGVLDLRKLASIARDLINPPTPPPPDPPVPPDPPLPPVNLDPMWAKKLDEDGWRSLARAGIAKGGETLVVNYWWTNRDSRTNSEYREASENMSAELAVRSARGILGTTGQPVP